MVSHLLFIDDQSSLVGKGLREARGTIGEFLIEDLEERKLFQSLELEYQRLRRS